MQSLPAGVGGLGNIIADPRFVNPLGPDNIPGTEDDDLRLRADSPCIDSGDTTSLPADAFDLDNDGDTAEPLPLDIAGNARVLETPHAPNLGVPHPNPPGGSNGWPIRNAIVDMGAHEYRRPADIAPSIGDGMINVDDLLLVITQWGLCEAGSSCEGDVTGDGAVNVDDLLAIILSWG